MTYYWKIKDEDEYHWHADCHVNHYPAEGWTKGDKYPAGREQCDHCKAIDDKLEK